MQYHFAARVKGILSALLIITYCFTPLSSHAASNNSEPRSVTTHKLLKDIDGTGESQVADITFNLTKAVCDQVCVSDADLRRFAKSYFGLNEAQS